MRPVATAMITAVSKAMRMLLNPPSSGSKVRYFGSSCGLKKGDTYLASFGMSRQYTISFAARSSNGPPCAAQFKPDTTCSLAVLTGVLQFNFDADDDDFTDCSCDGRNKKASRKYASMSALLNATSPIGWIKKIFKRTSVHSPPIKALIGVVVLPIEEPILDMFDSDVWYATGRSTIPDNKQ